jgi:hypothetical protein
VDLTRSEACHLMALLERVIHALSQAGAASCPLVDVRAGCRSMPARRDMSTRLRLEAAPGPSVLVVRGGPDTIETLQEAAARTAEVWDLDGVPLLGISACALLDGSLEELLRARFKRFRVVHRLECAWLENFRLLPTFTRPHYTVCLQRADKQELEELLAALGPPELNPEYHESD